MDNFKKLLIFLWILFFLFLFFNFLSYLKYIKILKKLKKQPLPQKYKSVIQNLPEYKKLSQKHKKILEYKIQRFMLEKEFIGIKLNITDEIKAIVSFYACIPTLAYLEFCYPSLKKIFIYPHFIVLNQTSNDFLVTKEKFLISGEATGEYVILVWDEIKKEIKHNKGRNVIIHEFAHELDFEEGSLNGIPPLEKNKYLEWTKIMKQEFEKFKKKRLKNRFLGKYSLIDNYSTTNPSEFFAVLSEYYFENPKILKKHFPKIYKELKNFYKVELCT